MCSLSKAKLSITWSVLFNTFQHPNCSRLRQKNTNKWIPSNALQSALRLNQVIKSNDKMSGTSPGWSLAMNIAARTFGRWTASRYWTSVHDTSVWVCFSWNKKKHWKHSDSACGISYRMQKTLLRRVFIVRITEARPKVIVYYRHWYAVYPNDFKRSRMSLSVFRCFMIFPYRGSFKTVLAKAGLNRSEGLQIHMSSITPISTIRTHQRHVPARHHLYLLVHPTAS